LVTTITFQLQSPFRIDHSQRQPFVSAPLDGNFGKDGLGSILEILIALKIGEVRRCSDGAHLASYCGAVPRVKSSGGKTYYGKTRPDVNRYLKWGLTEAANAIVVNQRRMTGRHVMTLYRRICQSKGHAKAIGALRRHLAEAAYAVLKSGQPYHEPIPSKRSSVTREVCARLA
jgi:hypothetical protein